MEYVIIRSRISLRAFNDFLPSQIRARSRLLGEINDVRWISTFRDLILVPNNGKIIDTTNRSKPLKRFKKKKIISKILFEKSEQLLKRARKKFYMFKSINLRIIDLNEYFPFLKSFEKRDCYSNEQPRNLTCSKISQIPSIISFL